MEPSIFCLTIKEVYQRALVRAELQIWRLAKDFFHTDQYWQAVQDYWDLYGVCKANGYLD